MLARLIDASEGINWENRLISLTGGGPVAQKIQDRNVEVHSLNMRVNSPDPFKIIELARILRKQKPDIVQTWMYHADLVGGIAAKISVKAPVVWGVRNNTFDPSLTNPRTIKLSKLNAKIANYLPDAIICNSKSATSLHVQIGYPKEKFSIIPNGYNTKEFTPNPRSRRALREELGVPDSMLLIGIVGRFDPLKGFKIFIEAAGLISPEKSDVNFVLVGTDVDWDNAALAAQIQQADLVDKVHLLGPRNDINHIMAGLDILTSVSYAESFPNVVAEAMACGVSCVVTDVGDSAFIVDGFGTVVPVGDPAAVVEAWQKLLSLSERERIEMSNAARERVVSKFGIERMVSAYARLYHFLTSRNINGA